MIPVDLITGMLGSGKTTFLRAYAQKLIGRGMSIGIIENDYGAINIDRLLLGDLDEEACDVEMVIGGDEDCRRRRLKTKLISMAMCGYDRILIEPSGVYETDEFFDLLQEEPLDRLCRPGNVIALADASLGEELSPSEEYLLAEQAACAGRVVLSHMDEAGEEAAERVRSHINRALAAIHADRQIRADEVLARSGPGLTEEEFEGLVRCSYVSASYVRLQVLKEHAYQSLFFFHPGLSGEEIRARAEKIFADPACGRISRIKGFAPAEEGFTEINLRPGQMKLTASPAGQDVIIVIGEHPDEERISAYFDKTAQTE